MSLFWRLPCPPSIRHTYHPTTYLSPAATPRQDTGPRPLLFWTPLLSWVVWAPGIPLHSTYHQFGLLPILAFYQISHFLSLCYDFSLSLHLIHILFTYASLLRDTCLIICSIYAAFHSPLKLVLLMRCISPWYLFYLFTQPRPLIYINYCSSRVVL